MENFRRIIVRKKLLCMALMMSMTVGLLSGCGTSSKSATKATGDSKSNGPVEVEFWLFRAERQQ